jgi:hypothetical protein
MSNCNRWSPFTEPHFANVTYALLESSPPKLAQHLRSEGMTRDFWRQLGLPDATAPPKDQNPSTEAELLELFAAIADELKASRSSDRRCLRDSGQMDYVNGRFIDLWGFSTLNHLNSPLPLCGRSGGQYGSLNASDLLDSASSSPLSVFSNRRSSLGRPALLVESRQPSRQESAMNRRPNLGMGHWSNPDIRSLQVGPQLDSPSYLAFDNRSFHQSILPSSYRMKEVSVENSTKAKDYLGAYSFQSRSALTETAHFNPELQTTALSDSTAHARMQSSDGSHVTNDTTSLRHSSISSTSAVNRPYSADSEGDLSVKHQHLSTEIKMVLSQHHQGPSAHACEADAQDLEGHIRPQHGSHAKVVPNQQLESDPFR